MVSTDERRWDMTLSNMTKSTFAALMGLGLAVVAPANAQTTEPSDEGLASTSLADGR